VRVALLAPASFDVLEWKQPPPRDIAGAHNAPVISVLANALVSLGHEVVLCSLSQSEPSAMEWSDGPLTLCVVPARPRHRARDLFRQERMALASLAAKHACDIVHAHWTYEYAWAAFDTGLPTLVTVHDFAPLVLWYRPDAYRAVRLAMDRVTLHRAPHLSVTSPHLLRLLPPSAQGKARVVPNPILPALAASDTRGDAPADAPVVLTVVNGRGRGKNIKSALRAARIWSLEEPGARLFVIGEDMQPDGPVAAWAQTNGLGQSAVFLGPLPHAETMRRMRGSSMLLHTSRQEGFGMTIVEAMVLGTPVVAGGSSGNVGALLGDGAYGVACDIEDPADVAAAVLSVLREPLAVAACARRAQARALRLFSADTVARRYVAAYHDVLGAANGGGAS
jgi:glycosyltransferase involved in cell wall biosynthesis